MTDEEAIEVHHGKMLEKICDVYDRMKKNDWDGIREDKDKAVDSLSAYLGIDKQAVPYFCSIFALNYESGHPVDLDGISESFGITPIKLLVHKDVLMMLCDKKLCTMNRKQYTENQPAMSGVLFSVSADASSCIIDNKPVVFGHDDDIDKDDMVAFLDVVDSVLDGSKDDISGMRRTLRGRCAVNAVADTEARMDGCVQLNMIKTRLPDVTCRAMFYIFCNVRLGDPDGQTRLNVVVTKFYPGMTRCMDVARRFLDGSHPLVKQELVEVSGGGTFDNASVSVTDDGLSLMLGEASQLFIHRVSLKNLIRPEDIIGKDLFYSKGTEEKISMLRDALQEDKLCELRKRLAAKGLPQGIAALLYGGPGTGKTESVYQIAKATGRAVFHVDIASTKSCWFGESEKIIRTMFKKYRKVCEDAQKDGTRMPVMFFNEADAVLSRRRDVDSGNTAKTENTIQDIILEEMETLNGIMIATTNLADNLDAAFERRFLFKIHIGQPAPEARAKIWQSKIGSLSEAEAEMLAESYDFSGGEIDNIVRKTEIEHVIRGTVPSVAEIRELCSDERIESGSGACCIGFRE